MTNDHGSGVVDIGAVAIWLAAFFNFLPSIAALLSVIWLIIRIAESRTVQHALGARAWIKDTDRGNENQ